MFVFRDGAMLPLDVCVTELASAPNTYAFYMLRKGADERQTAREFSVDVSEAGTVHVRSHNASLLAPYNRAHVLATCCLCK